LSFCFSLSLSSFYETASCDANTLFYARGVTNNECEILDDTVSSAKYSWPYYNSYDTVTTCSGTPSESIDLETASPCVFIGSDGADAGEAVDPLNAANSYQKFHLVNAPTALPTVWPTAGPTTAPIQAPTTAPTASPTFGPTVGPTATANPSVAPTVSPSVSPTKPPTVNPTAVLSQSPTVTPTANPTGAPTVSPTKSPTVIPTAVLSQSPTVTPTASPTGAPTVSPTKPPTVNPTANPTGAPTVSPTKPPTVNPTANPTGAPTVSPTKFPTVIPTAVLSQSPSATPTLSFAPTAGHLLTLTGDVALNNIDYSSFSASEKNDFLEGAENALESLWHLDDGSVVVTADATTTRRRLTTNSGVELHFTIVATDLSITGSSSSSGSAVTQSMTNEINTHFFTALQTSVAANPALQAAVGAAQVQEVTVTNNNNSSENDKDSSDTNLLAIILPVVLGFFFVVGMVAVLATGVFNYRRSGSANGDDVEMKEKKAVEEGTVGYGAVVSEEQIETSLATNNNVELAI
jgi:hypothetical protein